jgi:hypothetical protein
VATLYVNSATGSDVTTRAGNAIGTPWATVGRAVWGSATRATPDTGEAAQAGDIVIVAGGTYTSSEAGSAAREEPFYQPANSGTAGNPITFQTDGDVVAFVISSYVGPQIGAYQREYIVWDGFTINEVDSTSAADTGPVVLWESEHCTVQNCIINGTTTAFGDNHNGVRIESCDDCHVVNCDISDIDDSIDSGNASCVTFYESTNCTVDRCTLSNATYGVFVKGANPGPVDIFRNLIHDCPIGIKYDGIEAGGGDCHQNILYDCTAGFTLLTISGGNPHPQNVRIINNTIHSSGAGSRAFNPGGTDAAGWDGIEIKNNIVYEGQWIFESDTMSNATWLGVVGASPSAVEIEHNVYNGETSVFGRVPSNQDYATWTAATGTDVASPASSRSDPLFVDDTTRDYRLQSGSPARLSCPDILSLFGGGTCDAGARQFADNGDPIQIGFDGDAEPEPPVEPIPFGIGIGEF